MALATLLPRPPRPVATVLAEETRGSHQPPRVASARAPATRGSRSRPKARTARVPETLARLQLLLARSAAAKVIRHRPRPRSAATVPDRQQGPTPAPAGSYCDQPGLSSPKLCDEGWFQDLVGQSSCKACPAGHNCPRGCTKPNPITCNPASTSPATRANLAQPVSTPLTARPASSAPPTPGPTRVLLPARLAMPVSHAVPAPPTSRSAGSCARRPDGLERQVRPLRRRHLLERRSGHLPELPARSVVCSGRQVMHFLRPGHDLSQRRTSQSQCKSSCQGGQTLVNGQCQSCPAGTYSSDGQGSCTTCAANSWSAAGAKSCTPCDQASLAAWAPRTNRSASPPAPAARRSSTVNASLARPARSPRTTGILLEVRRQLVVRRRRQVLLAVPDRNVLRRGRHRAVAMQAAELPAGPVSCQRPVPVMPCWYLLCYWSRLVHQVLGELVVWCRRQVLFTLPNRYLLQRRLDRPVPVQAQDLPARPDALARLLRSLQGRHFLRGRASTCTVCPANTWSSGGAAKCTACDAGLTCSEGATEKAQCKQVCQPGQKTVGSLCLDCLPGTFSTDGSALTCQLCPAGTFASSSGSAKCDPCTATRSRLVARSSASTASSASSPTRTARAASPPRRPSGDRQEAQQRALRQGFDLVPRQGHPGHQGRQGLRVRRHNERHSELRWMLEHRHRR